MELPQNLQIALESEFASTRSKHLSNQATELSNRYRSGRPTGDKRRFASSKKEITAYAAFRLPATYAAVSAALNQVKLRLPGWTPCSLLDVGAGPGTATWAATETWPEIDQITLLEREDEMIELGKRLATHSDRPSFQKANWSKVDLTGSWQADPHDLIIISYSLGEWPESSRQRLLLKLWEMTTGALVVIEPGTPEGYSRIITARDQLLAEGAHTIAPCPHDLSCPIKGENWCHFSQRISRSRFHRQVKGAELSYEDEKFSFACMSRLESNDLFGRVIRHPQVRKGHIRLEVCTQEGIKDTVVTRKKKEHFRTARRLNWGDELTESIDD